MAGVALNVLSLRDPRGSRWTVEVPTTRRERMRGLRYRDELKSGHALLLKTNSVHTFGMRFAIDGVMLDRSLKVLRVHRMPPGRLLLPRPRVRYVLECRAGSGFQVGDVLVQS